MNEIVSKKVIPSSFYGQVMSWLFTAFAVSAATAMLLGPLVPDSMVTPLMIGMLVVMIIAAFTKMSTKFSGFLTILIPGVMGISLHKIISSYVDSGAGNIVVAALVITAIVFGVTAILAWMSSKTLYSLLPKMFIILLAIIGISLLNIFFFQLEILGLLIAIASAAIFTIYTYIDIQSVRDRFYGDDVPASFYALNIFLDIINLFLAILRILSSVMR